MASSRASLVIIGIALGLSGCAHGNQRAARPVEAAALVSFPTQDGGIVFAHAYGRAAHAVILGSNGCRAKEGWAPQAQVLAAAGYRALAIDFRGEGQSRGGPGSPPGDDRYHLDVLAAIRYLRQSGAARVSIIGASCAGDAAAQASVDAQPGEIDHLILLGSGGIAEPERMKGRTLFVVTRDDANDAGPRLPAIREQYARAPQPKELLILEGSARAQRIFETDLGERLMREILRFLATR